MHFAECVAHVALAVATALAWLGLGSVLLARVPRTGDAALDVLNRYGAGAVGFALLTLAAAAAGLLYRAVYLPVFALCAVAGALSLRGVPRPRLGAWRRWDVALALLLAGTAALTLVATCAPITAFDALHYHASAPVRDVEAHELLEFPWGWSTYQPFTVEMLVADGALLWNPVQGAFAPFLLAFGALAATMAMGERVGGRGLALLAGAILFVQPLLVFEASGTLIETGIALAVALAAWNAAVFVVRGGIATLALSGVFAGAAAGTKYVGLFVPLAVAAALLVALRSRVTLRAVVAFALPAALVSLPWYVKNAIQTGNPLFPFVFGGVTEEARRFIEGGIREHGHGRGPLDAAALPFRLLAEGDDFDRGSWLSPLPLLFAPVALLDERARRLVVPALVGCAVFLAAWFATSQQARFLLALAPVTAVLAAVGIVALARAGRLGRIAAVGVTAAALATGFAMSLVYTTQFLPVALGAQGSEELLREKTPYYDGVRWLNEHLDGDDRALLDFAAVLYVDDPYVVWTPLVLSTNADPVEARRFAEENDLTHAAVLDVNLEARRPTLEALGAREIATVPVQAPVFGLRIRPGQPERLHVFELGRR